MQSDNRKKEKDENQKRGTTSVHTQALERHTGTGTVKELSGIGCKVSMNSIDFIYKNSKYLHILYIPMYNSIKKLK